ncbi:MAG: hypothetical protein U0Q11_27935, partial [Vicinamibacterales bacterium]
MLQNQHRLDEADDASRSLQMSDVGFDRAKVAGLRSISDYCGEGFDFNRIAERRSGAMCLDVADTLRVELSVGQGFAQHRLLRQ